MTLKDLLDRLRLDNEVKVEPFRFRNETYEVFRAKRSEALLPRIPFSEYFFVEVSEAAMTKMTEEADLSYFREFQTKLLSKPFFSYKSDVRWNLYLILVIESYDLLKDSSMLHKIENDADYARKFVATPADVFNWLDKEWLHTAAADKTKQVDPLQEWNDHLEPFQLTGCLTQTFGEKHVNHYLNGLPFLSEETAPTSRRSGIYDDYEEKIGTIDSIAFDGFRKHCFAYVDPMHPTNVNLLYGSNGSGKTSAMEAIELALTNDIRRCSEFGDTVEETANQLQVLCRTESGRMLPFQSGKPVALYKRLAQSWYGVTSGRQSELNYYFHRFNYFDSEAAYRFALSESSNGNYEKFAYSDNLSRLVFGDSILATQNKWQRYKEEFEKQLQALTKQKTEVRSLITTLDEKMAALNHIKAAQPIELDTLLASIQLRKSTIEQGTAGSGLAHLESLNLLLKSVEPRRKEIIEFPIPNVTLTLEYVQTQLLLSKDKLDLLLEDRDSRFIFRQQLKSEQNRIRTELTEWGEQELLLQQSLDDIKLHLQEWEEIRQVIEGHSQVQQRSELEQKWELLNHRLTTLQKLEARFSRLSVMSQDDWTLLSREELQQLHRSVEEKTQLLTQSKNQLEAAEKVMDEVNTLISRLQHLGKDFLELDGHSTTCPLCKHEHGTFTALTQAIQSAKSVNDQGDSDLDEWRQSVESLQADIDLLNEEIEQQDLNRRHAEYIADAYMELVNDPLFEIDVSLQKPENQLQSIHNLLAKKNEWKMQRDMMQNQLHVFDETGFSHHEIIRAELFQKENNLYRGYIERQSADSFEEYGIARQRELQDNWMEGNHRSAQLNNQTANVQQRLLEISFEELNQSISEQERQIGLWNHFKASMESLLQDFDFEMQDNLRVWAIQLEKVNMQIELLIEKHKHDQVQTQLRTEWELAGKTFDSLQNKIGRCEIACKALGQLSALKTYTEEFINKNISKIERFFKMLHTPREFDEIRLEEDGLTLHRKWDGNATKAFQMSSGQRASLALSVMFAIHLAAPSAPKFIIMDEPVANMDDLHLMNLLDLLRDLALSGRQIFFTTANPDVANLFRRKFSFFQEQFTHFEFSRNSGEPVHIQSMKYSPDRESPVSHIS